MTEKNGVLAWMVVSGIEMFPGSCILRGVFRIAISTLSCECSALIFFQTHDILKHFPNRSFRFSLSY